MITSKLLIVNCNKIDIGAVLTINNHKILSKKTDSKETSIRKKVDKALTDLNRIIDDIKSKPEKHMSPIRRSNRQ